MQVKPTERSAAEEAARREAEDASERARWQLMQVGCMGRDIACKGPVGPAKTAATACQATHSCMQDQDPGQGASLLPVQDDEAELLGAALQLSLEEERERQQRAARKAAASPQRAPLPRQEAYIPQSMAAMSAECALPSNPDPAGSKSPITGHCRNALHSCKHWVGCGRGAFAQTACTTVHSMHAVLQSF